MLADIGGQSLSPPARGAWIETGSIRPARHHQQVAPRAGGEQYIQRMKRRDPELGKGCVQIVHTLPIERSGGTQSMLCANTEGIFRIIQSIPSPKAEPFKRWLAKVGYERVQEIEDPELATKRTRKS